MIITQLNGGLGNQMFQYATARCIAEKACCSLLLDISVLSEKYESKTYRNYGLNVFNIKADIANSNICKIAKRAESKYLKYLNFFFFPKLRIIKESGFAYEPFNIEPGENIYLKGYWQSEKYFSDIREIILKEFLPKNEVTGKNKDMNEIISSVNSVSVHVRRGDYVANPITNRVHGVCDTEYYNKAMHHIESKVENPHYFIFSDDIPWCKENISSQNQLTFVDINTGEKAYEDLRLMSFCKHNIIANSSFSWWGAWLNANPKKIVIAPKKWFNDSSRETKDLFPDSWVMS